MTSRETLPLVDDEPTNLTVINEFLRRDYCTRVATDGRRAPDSFTSLERPHRPSHGDKT